MTVTVKYFKESGKLNVQQTYTIKGEPFEEDKIIGKIFSDRGFAAVPFVFEAWNEDRTLYSCRLITSFDR